MRAISILCLLLILAYVGNLLFETHRLNAMYKASMAAMPGSTAYAIQLFKPSSDIDSAETFGAAARVKRKWVEALINTAISNVCKKSFTVQDADNVVAALKELSATKLLTPTQRVAAHQKIFDAIRALPLGLEKNGFLPDFDESVKFLQRLRNDAVLDNSLLTRLEETIAQAQAIDRYPIALRTVTFETTTAMHNGLSYMHLATPTAPGVVHVPMTTDSSQWDAITAERCFDETYSKLTEFRKQWSRPLPPQLERLVPISVFDSAILQFGYAVLSKRKDGTWNIYLSFKPATDAGEFEIRSTYLMGIRNKLGSAKANAGLLPANDPAAKAFSGLLPVVEQGVNRLSPGGDIAPLGIQQLAILY